MSMTIQEATLEELRRAAQAAAEHAYAPYSKFHVGAALLFDDGRIFTGCNVENISYGLSSCAERNALFRAISERGPGPKIVAVAVTNRDGASCSPCGACRQVLSEFVTPDAVVTFPWQGGAETMLFRELLPRSFSFESQGEEQ
jgi:cytidine deaminase